MKQVLLDYGYENCVLKNEMRYFPSLLYVCGVFIMRFVWKYYLIM